VISDPAVTVEREIKARPETVYSFFTDPAKWLSWQGVDATIEPVAGGVFRINVRGDGYASGRFVELIPPRRVVFTWGWEHLGNAVPPGSSRVEVDLIPDETGTTTLVRLRHYGLPVDAGELHRAGWEHYLTRLQAVAGGGDPGPDPWLAAFPA
jgi:uncharacterized protein YndB with AHSA1/START domain